MDGPLLRGRENPNTDSDEAQAGYPTNDLGAHVVSDQGAGQNGQRRGEHESSSGRREHGELGMRRFGRVQETGKLGLITELGDEDGGEDRCKEFDIDVEPRVRTARARAGLYRR